MRAIAGWANPTSQELTPDEVESQMAANGNRAWKSFFNPPQEGVGVLRKVTKRPLGLKQGN
jgi:hypothetical protein